MAALCLVIGTVARRKNCGRTITFLHVVLDAPLVCDSPDGHSVLAIGSTVQLVCTDGTPAPRLARGGARLEAKGTLEKGSDWQNAARPSILVSEIELVTAPAHDASSIPPMPTLSGSTLCRDWMRGSPCAAGDKCDWRHAVPTGDEAVKIEILAARAAASRASDDFAQATAAAAAGGEICESCDGSPILKAAKGARNSIFASWIVETYGLDALHAGTGVVDVAGGKGLISLELALAHGVPCTVLDPRHARPSAGELRRIRQRCVARVAAGKDGGEDTRTNKAKEPASFNDKSKDGSNRFAESLVTYVQMALPDGVDADSGQYVEVDGSLPLLECASLLFGMHSDEATEAIVDAALRRNLNFAVVPCCAFPSRFPDRKMTTGDPVTTTAQFITYLKAKAPDGVIRQAWLPFEGRNAVLFTVK